MQPWPIERKIRYESELNPTFAQQILAAPGGEALSHCIQCGTCSATCPLSIYMDYTPRRIMAMTRAGFMSDVLQSFTIWLCASCYACSVECPREIRITDIMYLLKRHAIQQGLYPRRFAIPVLARQFFKLVQRFGRMNEARLIAYLSLRTGPWRYIRKVGIGFRLWRSGRLTLRQESIHNRKELYAILETVEELKLDINKTVAKTTRVEP